MEGGHAEADGIIQIFEGSGRFPGCVPLLAQRFQSVVIGQIRGAHGCLQKESWGKHRGGRPSRCGNSALLRFGGNQLVGNGQPDFTVVLDGALMERHAAVQDVLGLGFGHVLHRVGELRQHFNKFK